MFTVFINNRHSVALAEHMQIAKHINKIKKLQTKNKTPTLTYIKLNKYRYIFLKRPCNKIMVITAFGIWDNSKEK